MDILVDPERASQVVREGLGDELFLKYSPRLAEKTTYKEPELTEELMQFMALFLEGHEIDPTELKELLELDEEVAVNEAVCVLGWIYLQEIWHNGEEVKLPARWVHLETYQKRDTIMDAIVGFVLRERRFFHETVGNYADLWYSVLNLTTVDDIGNLLIKYRLRRRSANKDLENLLRPSPLLEGPNCFELMQMMRGFLAFANSFAFTIDRDFVAFVLKVKFDETSEQEDYKQQDPGAFWDDIAPYNRTEWPTVDVDWKRHFDKVSLTMDGRLPVCLMERSPDETVLCHRTWTELDKANFFPEGDEKSDDLPQFAPQKIVSDVSASCISFDAMKIEEMVRVYVTFAGHRLRLRSSEDIWQIATCMSQMIVVESDATANADRVVEAVTEACGGQVPAVETTADSVKIVILNNRVSERVASQFEDVGVRVGEDADFGTLSRGTTLPLIETMDDVFVDGLQDQLSHCQWFTEQSFVVRSNVKDAGLGEKR